MLDIIIPAYNSHKYITGSLNSLAKQSIIDKVKITIIDDGSKKKYDDIISSFPSLNINLIRLKRNKGVAIAKQIGINKTNNEYLMFMDSDDILIGNKTLEKLYNKITSNKELKVVMGKEYKEGKTYYNKGHMVAKIFKREIINKYKIKLPNLKIEEDTAFTLSYYFMLKEEEKGTIKEVVYRYRTVNKNSITSKFQNNDYKNFFKAIDYAYKYVKKYHKYEEFKKEIHIIYLIIASDYYHEFYNKVELRESYLKNCYKFYQKYKKYLGDIPKIGQAKYNDEEYDLACRFYKVLQNM